MGWEAAATREGMLLEGTLGGGWRGNNTGVYTLGISQTCDHAIPPNSDGPVSRKGEKRNLGATGSYIGGVYRKGQGSRKTSVLFQTAVSAPLTYFWMGQRDAVSWLPPLICLILFSLLVCCLGNDPRSCVSHSHFKGNQCCSMGLGKHCGETSTGCLGFLRKGSGELRRAPGTGRGEAGERLDFKRKPVWLLLF